MVAQVDLTFDGANLSTSSPVCAPNSLAMGSCGAVNECTATAGAVRATRHTCGLSLEMQTRYRSE